MFFSLLHRKWSYHTWAPKNNLLSSSECICSHSIFISLHSTSEKGTAIFSSQINCQLPKLVLVPCTPNISGNFSIHYHNPLIFSISFSTDHSLWPKNLQKIFFYFFCLVPSSSFAFSLSSAIALTDFISSMHPIYSSKQYTAWLLPLHCSTWRETEGSNTPVLHSTSTVQGKCFPQIPRVAPG